MEHKVFLFGDAAQARTLARYRSLMRSTVAPLLLRLVLAVAFVGHGAQKLFGWFGGLGLAGTAGYFDSVGLSPGRPLALLSGLAELGGGILLGLGLLTPLAALVLAGNMAVAIATVNVHHGFFSTDGQNGFELPLTFAAVAVTIGLLGPGPISLDHLLARVFRRRGGRHG